MMEILVVDDDGTDLMLLTHLIHDVDPSITITEASSGAQGIENIRQFHYDCVFLDYFLPDLNGIEILKEIYDTNTGLAPHPIVMLASIGQETIMMDAIKYGAQDYLLKQNISGDGLLFSIKKAQYIYNLKRTQNETEKRLHHSQKIEALGRLTGGIAHDFNNLLTIILGNTRLLRDKLENNDADLEYQLKKIDTINNAAERGADLVQHLMVFSHQRELKVSPTNINIVLDDMRNLLLRTIGKTVTIIDDLSDTLWLADLDPMQLEHLVINILANARDAMPDGGALKIATNNVILGDDDACELHVDAGSYVCLSISDTGLGIPDEIQNKIFDPFFTTKDVGKGTGLGMSTAYGFARECGGTIHVVSEENQGTTFKIYFPKSNAAGKEERDGEHFLALTGAAETILIVEDEIEINEMTSIILGKHGYKILQASNANEALDILMDTTQHVDLLFTDIVMPGEINGVQLAARALVLRSEINILFTTGFMKASIPDINLLDEYTVLNKPYKPNELLHRVYDALLTK